MPNRDAALKVPGFAAFEPSLIRVTFSKARKLGHKCRSVSQAANQGRWLAGAGGLKWSGKPGQPAKMYPTMTTGYTNDEETQFFGQV